MARHSRSPSPAASSSKRARTSRDERDRDDRRDRDSRDDRRDRDRDRDRDRRDRERRRSRSRERERSDRRDSHRDRDRDRDRERDSRRSARSPSPSAGGRTSGSSRRDRERDSSDRPRDSHRERERDRERRDSPAGSSSSKAPAIPTTSRSSSKAASPAPISATQPVASTSIATDAPAKKTETPEEEKLRTKRERLEAFKAKKAAERAAAEASATSVPSPSTSTSATPAAAVPPKSSVPSSTRPAVSNGTATAARLGLPISASLPAKPLAPSPLSTSLRSAPVGLPKKPAFSAFGASASSSSSNASGKGKSKRATAAGMMDEDDSEGKTVLYKPEQGAHIEGGLEPDKPTASQLEAMKRAEAETNGMDIDEQAHEAEEHDETALDDGLDHLHDDDEDDEFKDGGPSVKAAPLSKAQIQALQEEREAEEIEARSRAKAKMDLDNKQADEEEEVDPLDAFMMDVEKEKTKVDKEDLDKLAPSGASDSKIKVNGVDKKGKKSTTAAGAKGLIDMFEDDSGGESDSEIPDLDDIDKTSLKPEDILALAQKKLKKRDIAPVDHSKITYEGFRKQFYHPPPEIEEMSNEETEALRVELDNIKIRGVECPKPITKWSHCGLPAVCLEVIRSLGYPKPTSIQSQAIPAIMSGRDVIGVAKTGSGKTVAFLLPMFRHIKDQRPLEQLEGPIAMVMTPTRELATQIAREAKPFLKALGLRVTAAYGGSPLKDNIADMKRGAEVIVCTPGRMIELLITNSGRIINLRRITYLVLDEADRMFDMGFEPQVMKILSQIRPDRQTVLFSATFPRAMEALARKILKKPLEITVGGRSVVAAEIEQLVEVREEESKFNRLLEILGRTYNDDADTRTLIFVHRQDSADNLLRDLLAKNYACMSLHGGKEQVDRDAVISDFKAGIIPIVIATSVAARGLDVKLLKLVINYDCPNHMEDYVHRAGRTGRAGNKGTCITFITPDQDRYAVDLQKALEASKVEIPADLKKLADGFIEKVKAGKATAASSGFGGKGLERLEQERDAKDRAQRSAYGEDDSNKEKDKDKEGGDESAMGKKGEEGAQASHPGLDMPDIEVEVRRGPAPDTGRKGYGIKINEANLASLKAAETAAQQAGIDATGISKAQSVIAKLTASIQARKQQQFGGGREGESDLDAARRRDPDATEYHAVVPIGRFGQRARWKVTNKETISRLIEETGASITNKGVYYEKGKEPTGPDDPPHLHLLVESNIASKVEHAIREIKQLLFDASVQALEADANRPGKYSV